MRTTSSALSQMIHRVTHGLHIIVIPDNPDRRREQIRDLLWPSMMIIRVSHPPIDLRHSSSGVSQVNVWVAAYPSQMLSS